MEEQDLERINLLKKLHSISFYMFLTALTSEYCLEVEVITSQGTSYSWESLDDFEFDVYRINGIEAERFSLIKQKITNGSVCLDDLNGTTLSNIVRHVDESEMPSKLIGLLSLPDKLSGDFYCIEDSDTETFTFFSSEKKVADELSKTYPVDTKWEDMGTESLREYLSRIESCGEYEVPFTSFGED